MRIIILNVILSKSNRTRLSKLAKYGFEMKLLGRDPNNEKNEKKEINKLPYLSSKLY